LEGGLSQDSSQPEKWNKPKIVLCYPGFVSVKWNMGPRSFILVTYYMKIAMFGDLILEDEQICVKTASFQRFFLRGRGL